MEKDPDMEFTVTLKNGQEVKAKWTRDNIVAGLHHLELYGPMTSTGYRSEFFAQPEEDPEGPDREDIVEYAELLAQKCWDENKQKYGTQISLV